MKWIDWWYLSKLQDQNQAVADAKTAAEADPAQAVGTPVLPIFSEANYAQSQDWVKDYINVPLDDMKGYTDVMFTQTLVPEASASVQDLYGQLFPVVQAVITDKNADMDKLLPRRTPRARQSSAADQSLRCLAGDPDPRPGTSASPVQSDRRSR